MESHLSRRTALLAIGGATAVAAVPVAALASGPSVDRSAWDRAFAALKRARTEYDAADAVFDRVHDAWEAGRPSMDMIHWKEFPYAERCHTARVMDLDRAWQQFLGGEGKWWFAKNAAERKAKHHAALDSVREFRRQEAEHDRKHGYSEASDRLDAAVSLLADAEAVLLKMPAPDAAALQWKLENLFGEPSADGFSESWSREIIEPVMADARRLLSNGRA